MPAGTVSLRSTADGGPRRPSVLTLMAPPPLVIFTLVREVGSASTRTAFRAQVFTLISPP